MNTHDDIEDEVVDAVNEIMVDAGERLEALGIAPAEIPHIFISGGTALLSDTVCSSHMPDELETIFTNMRAMCVDA